MVKFNIECARFLDGDYHEYLLKNTFGSVSEYGSFEFVKNKVSRLNRISDATFKYTVIKAK